VDFRKLTALECTEFFFGRGSAPDPAGGAYSWFKADPTCEGKGEEGMRRAEGPAPLRKFLDPPLQTSYVTGEGREGEREGSQM